MSDRIVLVAHQSTEIRERFAGALAEGRHQSVLAKTEAEALGALRNDSRPLHLALLDLRMSADGAGFARRVRQGAGNNLPIVVFAGSVTSAALATSLTPLAVTYLNEHAAAPQILPALAPHLFPDSFNRRASHRVTIGIPVSYRVGQTTAGAVTLDVGKGGLAVRTIKPLPRGAALRLKFRLPGGSHDIESAGRVVWSDSKVGMGLQFETLSSNDQRAIDAFIDGVK